MKKSLIFCLLLGVFALSSCERRSPYYYGGYGDRDYRDPNGGYVVNPESAVVCSEYADRHKLSNGKTVYVSDYETLVYSTSDQKKALQLYWADCKVYVDGYFVYIYQYDSKGAYLSKVLDKRRNSAEILDVLAAYPENPDLLCTRRVKVEIVGSKAYVYLLDGSFSLEAFVML